MTSEISIKTSRIFSELTAKSIDVSTIVEEIEGVSTELALTTRQLEVLLIEAKQDVSTSIWLRAGTSQHIHNNFPVLEGIGVDSDKELTYNGKKIYDGNKSSGLTDLTIKFADIEYNENGYSVVDNVITLPNYPALGEDLYYPKASGEALESRLALFERIFTINIENGSIISVKVNAGIYTDSFISSGGLREETGGSEGGIAEVTIKFGDVEPNPEGYKTDDNGIIILPNYPTVEDIDLSKYLTIEDADNSYASKQDVNEFKALFNSMFIKVDDGNGNVSIKALLGLWSDSFISSGGLNDDITSGSVINSLSDITDVTITSPTNGQVLTYRNGVWVNEVISGGDMSGYLPLSGGTMSGAITLPSYRYIESLQYGINANNADIINLNSIYTADSAQSASEGIHFKRDNGNWDTISSYEGTLYYYPNRTLSSENWSDAYTILHSRNIGSYAALWKGYNNGIDVNTFDYGVSFYGVSNSTGLPSGQYYGSIVNLPYRIEAGKTTYMARIFIPNGDVTDRSMYYQTSLANSWNGWRKVISENESGNILIGTTDDNGNRLQVQGAITLTTALRMTFNNNSTCGLYPDSWISGADASRLWLYNTGKVAIMGEQGVEIHSDLTAYGSVTLTNELYCRGWLRTYDDRGWYNETYEGGIHMTDTNFVRTYNGKGFSSDFFNTGWGKGGKLPYTGWNWYRVAVGSTYGVNITLSIGKNFFHIGPDSAVFSISIGYHTSASAITLLSHNQNYLNFTSIRVVALSTSSYAIEVYLYNSVANTDSWYVSGISMGDWVFQAPALSDGGGTVTGQLGFDYGTTLATNGNAVISGNIYASGGITAKYASSSSDAKLKDNIALLSQEDAINILMALKPSSWNWKDGGELAYGLVAQDVESVLPCSVTYGEHLSLQYNMFHAFEISVAQNHETRLQYLERENKELKQELQTLKREYYGNR